MKTIEYKTCEWEECGITFIPEHGNQKYHTKACYQKAKRKRDREAKRIKRQQKSSVGDIDDQRQTPKNALQLYQQNILNEELERLLRKALSPLFLEVNNRIERLEINLDEFHYVLQQDPEIQKRIQWENQSIRQAMEVLKKFESTLLLHQIRIILQDTMGISKHTAERILKKAKEQLQRERSKNQSSMEDYS